jgi:PAS domain S-box-containing protein
MDELARKEKDAQAVLEITQTLASNLEFRSILFTVVQRIADVAKVDRVSIVLVRDEGSVGYVVAASDDEQLRDLPLDLAKYPEIKDVLSRGEPLVVADTATHPLFEIVRGDGASVAFSSLCLMPILYESRPLGVLFLRSRKGAAFGAREIALTKTVSSAMAIALRNARVLQTLRDETQQVAVARFEAERRLRSLQRYADFFESAADGIVVIDAEGRLLFSNPHARTITGYEEVDWRGQPLSSVFADGEGMAEKLRAGFLRGEFPQGVDIPVRRKTGEIIIVSVNFNSVLREEGAVLCSFRDVTTDRQVEAELTKTKDFLQRVIDSSVDAIISADMKGRVVLFNRAAERIYGTTAKDMLGRHVSSLYPEGGAANVMKLIREGGGRVEGLRIDVVDNEGALVPVAFSGALIFDRDSAVGSVGIFTDLREKMRMEQRLHRAQEQLIAQERQAAIAELAGAAAHELNQPLTSVMNYATLLKRVLEKDTSAYNAADVIETESARMADIVRKIGKITKYETKSYVGTQKILDLDKASEASSISLEKRTSIPPSGRSIGEKD